MPINKGIAGESKWQIQVKLNIIGFTLSFQNSKRLRDAVTSSICPVTVPLAPFCQCLV